MDFNLVDKELYLGSRRGLQDFISSHDNSALQVLTVESEDLCQVPPGVSQHKFVQLDDVKTSDLLSHFDDIVAFIHNGLMKGAVYVHCRHGISRSATACAAYLMATHRVTADQAVQSLRRCRPCVSPNAGFRHQLELYGRLGCRTSLEDPQFRRYRLRAAARTAGIDITRLPSLSGPLLLPDRGLPGSGSGSGSGSGPGSGSGSGPPAAVYRCGQCRTALFSDRSVIRDPDGKSTGPGEEGSLGVLPLPWMTAALQMSRGRISCPRCSRKLGTFSWLPDPGTAADEDFEPSFLITRSRVDHCPQRPPACGAARHLAGKLCTTAEDPVNR